MQAAPSDQQNLVWAEGHQIRDALAIRQLEQLNAPSPIGAHQQHPVQAADDHAPIRHLDAGEEIGLRAGLDRGPARPAVGGPKQVAAQPEHQQLEVRQGEDTEQRAAIGAGERTPAAALPVEEPLLADRDELTVDAMLQLQLDDRNGNAATLVPYLLDVDAGEHERVAEIQQVLADWDRILPLFWKVSPHPTVAPPQPRDVQKARRDAMLATSRTTRPQPGQ